MLVAIGFGAISTDEVPTNEPYGHIPCSCFSCGFAQFGFLVPTGIINQGGEFQ